MFQLVFEKMKVHILKFHLKFNALKSTREPFVYIDVAIHVFEKMKIDIFKLHKTVHFQNNL